MFLANYLMQSIETKPAGEAICFGATFLFSSIFGIRLDATQKLVPSGILLATSIGAMTVFGSACLQDKVFSQHGKLLGAAYVRDLHSTEFDQAHMCILKNCDEVQPYLEEYNDLGEQTISIANWFKSARQTSFMKYACELNYLQCTRRPLPLSLQPTWHCHQAYHGQPPACRAMTLASNTATC